MDSDRVTRVLIVDDHSVTRHGVALLCRNTEGIEVIGEASDGEEAIQRVSELLPDVVLMDVDMPRRDGISATRQIRQDHPSVGVVVLTVHEDSETVFQAINAGASGYLPKSATMEDIRSMVKAAAAGGSFLDPVQARKLLDQFNRYAHETKADDIYYLLTGREREILALVAEGLTTRQIASQLAISERTVDTHTSNIYRKLHVNNRVDAVREAMRARLVSTDAFAGREILALLAEGLTSRQIAERLAIPERTVNTRIGRIYRKLGVNNRGDAVREAVNIGLIAQP